MELVQLRLRNFRQHHDTEVAFRPGLTAVLGPNGAGKTTLLEGIAWALYGSDVLQGRAVQEDLRSLRVPREEPVEAELVFVVDGEVYRVHRQFIGGATGGRTQARLWRGDLRLAEGTETVKRAVRRLLGLSAKEFFATYFTSQKALAVLTNLSGPRERRLFVSRLLGYDRLRRMEQRVRDQRRQLESHVAGLRTALPNAEDLARRRREAEARQAEARRRLEEAEGRLSVVKADHERADAAWQEAQRRWAQRQDWEERYRRAVDDARSAEAEVRRREERLGQLARDEARFRELEAALVDLPQRRAELERLAEQRQRWERAQVLDQQRQRLQQQRDEVRAERDRRREAPAYRARFEEELHAVEARIGAVEQDLEAAVARYREDRSSVDEKRRLQAESVRELQELLQALSSRREEGVCPVCQRPLEERYESVRQRLQKELESAQQDLRWLEQRAEQLRREPEDVVAARQELEALKERRKKLEEKIRRCSVAENEFRRAEEQLAALEHQLAELERERAGLDVDYDPDAYERLRREVERLDQLDRDRARLAGVLAQRADWEQLVAEARERQARAEEERDLWARRLAEEALDPAAYEAARRAFQEADRAYRAVWEVWTQAKAQIETEERHLALIAEQEAERARKQEEVQELERQIRLHQELEDALRALFEDVNAQLGPELSQVATHFVSALTDGRYSELRLDDEFQIELIEDGIAKRMLSGGEEDLVHLVLRIALAKKITEDARRPLHLLVLDEVFGSLDEQRRDNVLDMLRHLQNEFRQILAISHIDSIRDQADQVLRVEYDPFTGSARVREELPGFAAGEPILAEVG